MHTYPTTALITGAGRGLGRTLATFLAGQGVNLIITARGGDELHRTAQDLANLAGNVIALPGDVRSAAHRRQLVAAAQEQGGLDLLVNNASMLGPSPQPDLIHYPLEVLDQVFEVNVLAPLGLIQVAYPLLKASRGLVVNISSDAAVAGYPGWGGYGASKAALELISRTLAGELEQEGVAVVTVDPGDMRTQMQQAAFPGEEIGDRPLPEVTLPFWAWLLAQEPRTINGSRFQAQAETWVIERA